MAAAKLNAQNEEQFHDAPDDFVFYDCEETFSDPIGSSSGAQIAASIPKALTEGKGLPRSSLRRRRQLKDSSSDSMESSRLNSSVSVMNFLNSREGKINRPFKIKEREMKSEGENTDSGELKQSLGSAVSNEKADERSTLTDANDDIGNTVGRDELNSREDNEAHTSLILMLAGIVIKAISFQIDLSVKICMFPLWLIYNSCMLVFNPIAFLRSWKGYLIRKLKRIWTLVVTNVSPFVYEWLKEHKEIWNLGLKCCWGLLWSTYVCAVLVGLLISAFVMGGLLIRGVVEEPFSMERSLNFDYSEKSPVALVPITTHPELNYDIYLEEKPEFGKGGVSRAIPYNYKLQVTVLLELPESEYNQNLGIFQVRVDFLASDGKILKSTRRPCMLHYKSQPVRLLLTFLKVAPILTGYISETQNLKINFKGLNEGDVPTDSLRVAIEPRAGFQPGAGIPEIYAASLILESELPLPKRVLWFWKKTLFVWISMTFFLMELVFALICCRPLIIPKLRLREATDRDALQQNNHPGPS